MQQLEFLLLGLGSGAVFGALALAVVTVFKTSGVVNFATGAIALLMAYVYAYLRHGELIVLIPGFKPAVRVSDPIPMWPALLLTLVIAAVFGLLLYILVFRPLRTAPVVARAVASLGIALLIPALLVVRIGTTAVAVEPLLPLKVWHTGSMTLNADRVLLAVIVLALACVLTAVSRFTRFGLLTRAAAETERGAYVSGVSPDRIAAINWMVGAVIAALAGILIAPIVPLVPIAYTLFIVPALAAAVVGRFEMAITAVVVGIGIGMLQSWVQLVASKHPGLPPSGLAELVPLILIVVFLVLRAKPLPTRGTTVLRSLGAAPRPRYLTASTVIGFALAVIGLLTLDQQLKTGLITSMIIAVIALSVVVVSGYAGQISLAQLTIAGVAGFLVGPLTNAWHLPFPIAPIVAAVIATALGVVIGLPALRIRGLAVAVVTLAMASALEALWFRNSSVIGSSGQNTPAPRIFGFDLGIGHGLVYPRTRFGILCLIVLTVVAVAIALLRRSQLGAQMLAIRANEKSAAAAGINVVRVKVLAFGIAAFIAGLGGSLLAYQQQTVTFESYSAMASVAMFAGVYLAGITSVSGGIVAGILTVNGLLYVVLDKLIHMGAWYSTVTSFLLVLTVIFNPEGIVGPIHAWWARLRPVKGTKDIDTITSAALPEMAKRPVTAARVELHLDDVSVHYGGVTAVDGISFDVAAGTMFGLIGPNGAGKTSVIDAISGLADYTGTVVVSGRDVGALSTYQRVRAGLGRTFQAIELYDDLSVIENIEVGRTAAVHRPESVAEHTDIGDLEKVLALLGLDDVRHSPAGELSQGHRQLVSIGRALAGSPNLLLLDEPAGGLDSEESQWLGRRLRRLREAGLTVLIVDHDMDLIFEICDEVCVLDFGRVIAHGTPAEVRVNPLVTEAYLGMGVQVDG